MTELLFLSVVSTLIGLLVPGAKESGIRKAVLFLCGVVFLYSIASFAVNAVDAVADFPKYLRDLLLPDSQELESYESDGERWVVEYSVRNIEAGVSALLENRYGLASGSVRTKAFTKSDADENIVLTHLTVYVDDEMSVYSAEIARYVTDILACPCDVVITE